MRTGTPLVVRSAERPGRLDRATEDRVFRSESVVLLLDGATDPRNLPFSGGWMATQIGSRLMTLLTSAPESDTQSAVETVTQQLVDEFGLTPGYAPSTTLAVLRLQPHQIEAYVIADSPIIIRTVDEELIEVRDDRIAQVSSRYPRPQGPADHQDELWQKRHQNIEKHRNQPGGFWAISASPEAASEAVTVSLPVESFNAAVLMSDGVSALGDDYDPAGWPDVFDQMVADPVATVDRTHELEASDPECTRWPRSKVHDDKALVAVTT